MWQTGHERGASRLAVLPRSAGHKEVDHPLQVPFCNLAIWRGRNQLKRGRSATCRGDVRLRQLSSLLRPIKRDLFEGWIKCILGLAIVSVRRKRARKKKRKPEVDATVPEVMDGHCVWMLMREWLLFEQFPRGWKRTSHIVTEAQP